MRLVLDTCVLVSAFRNLEGASGLLVESVLSGGFRPLISVPLVLEYEAVLTRKEHLEFSGFSRREAVRIVKGFCKAGEHVYIRYPLRPQLRDPDDEFVLETAFHGRADAIVTFNINHFSPFAKRFRIEVISPRDALERMPYP